MPQTRPPESICQHCGKAFPTRRGTQAKNLYCSVSCGARHRVVTDPDRTGRARARKMYVEGQPCEVCGEPWRPGRGQVVRHHRDSDRLNNSPENIAWLCRVHHSEAHGETDLKVGGGARPKVVGLLKDRAIAQAKQAAALRATGLKDQQIADEMAVSRESVSRWFRKYAAVI